MVGELCAYVRNYFLRDYKDPAKYIHVGHYKIEDGRIQDLPFLIEGQYYRIKGSALNDGVYVYGESGLRDEEFDGQIWAMYVPPDFVSLANEIEAWVEANASTLNSPYQSESFGGYSYSLKSGASGTYANGGTYGWQTQFAKRLSPYRRLNVL